MKFPLTWPALAPQSTLHVLLQCSARARRITFSLFPARAAPPFPYAGDNGRVRPCSPEQSGSPAGSPAGAVHRLGEKESAMKKITVRKAGTVRLTSAAASAYCCGASA